VALAVAHYGGAVPVAGAFGFGRPKDFAAWVPLLRLVFAPAVALSIRSLRRSQKASFALLDGGPYCGACLQPAPFAESYFDACHLALGNMLLFDVREMSVDFRAGPAPSDALLDFDLGHPAGTEPRLSDGAVLLPLEFVMHSGVGGLAQDGSLHSWKANGEGAARLTGVELILAI